MNKEKAANLTNLTLGSIMPVESVLEAYFTNNPELIVKALGANSKDANEMFKALEQANYEIENEKSLSGVSSYGDIQNKIVNQVVTPTNASFLETNIINNEQIIGEACPNLGNALSTLNNISKENLGMEIVR